MSNTISFDDQSFTPNVVPQLATSQSNKCAEKETFFQIIRKYATLSDCLRLAVAVAMGLFFLEGVKVVNDLQRFLTMLGLTAALTGAGLVMSLVLKEQRGSRVFISLGLLSVPVNFTVFGALVYSVMPLDGMAINYPQFAHWQVASMADITMAIVSGLAVLLPVVWMGYSVLARSARNWLSITLFLCGLVLVVPVRAEFWASILALSATAIAWWLCQRFSKDSVVVKTTEGRFAIALLFIAPIVVVVRSLFLYEVSGVLVLTLGAGLYLTMRQLMTAHASEGFYAGFITFIAASAALVIAVSGAEVISHYWSMDWAVITGSVLPLLVTLDLGNVSPIKTVANRLGVVLIVVASIALVAVSLSSPSSLITLSSAVVLAALIAYGYLFRFNIVAVFGCLGIAAIVIMNAEELWYSVAQTGWWGIAAGGATAIVAGSMLDRAGTVIEAKS